MSIGNFQYTLFAMAIYSADTSSSKSQKEFPKTALPAKILYQIRPMAYLPRTKLV